MRRLLELLFSPELANTEITLYCSGLQFTGKLLPPTDDEIIAMSDGDRIFALEAVAVTGFSKPAIAVQPLICSAEKDDQQMDEIATIAKEIRETRDENVDVMVFIRDSVRKRVLNYPDISSEVEKIIQEMGDNPQQEANGGLLKRIELLKSRKPGCVTALSILSAGVHYIGGNKEKAVGILWKAGQFKIALPIIREVCGEQFYLDCLGFAINDPDPQALEENRELLFHYVRLCQELGDVSLLASIANSALTMAKVGGDESFFSPLLWGSLLYLAQEKSTAEVEVSPESVLLRKIKQYYPNNAMLLHRQENLSERLEQFFSNAPSRIADRPDPETADAAANNTHFRYKSVSSSAGGTLRKEMPRPQYYVGSISNRIPRDQGCFWFLVKLAGQSTVYLDDRQIADPLLMHKLCSGTEKEAIGTKVCFRFASNHKGLCAADAVMARKDRLAYRTRLTVEGGIPLRYKYLPIRYNEDERWALGQEALDQAAGEAGDEQLDDVEFLIFLSDFLSNPQARNKIKYPAAVVEQEALAAFFEADCPQDGGSQVKWADSLDYLLRQNGREEWVELFHSVREGLESCHPLYIRPRGGAGSSSISVEALLSEYIFPEVARCSYENALGHISLWKDKTTKLRKNRGRPWERVCKMEDICHAALAGDTETLRQQTAELSDMLTEVQRKKLEPLFAAAGID